MPPNSRTLGVELSVLGYALTLIGRAPAPERGWRDALADHFPDLQIRRDLLPGRPDRWRHASPRYAGYRAHLVEAGSSVSPLLHMVHGTSTVRPVTGSTLT
jgi:hypothetical protein